MLKKILYTVLALIFVCIYAGVIFNELKINRLVERFSSISSYYSEVKEISYGAMYSEFRSVRINGLKVLLDDGSVNIKKATINRKNTHDYDIEMEGFAFYTSECSNGCSTALFTIDRAVLQNLDLRAALDYIHEMDIRRVPYTEDWFTGQFDISGVNCYNIKAVNQLGTFWIKELVWFDGMKKGAPIEKTVIKATGVTIDSKYIYLFTNKRFVNAQFQYTRESGGEFFEEEYLSDFEELYRMRYYLKLSDVDFNRFTEGMNLLDISNVSHVSIRYDDAGFMNNFFYVLEFYYNISPDDLKKLLVNNLLYDVSNRAVILGAVQEFIDTPSSLEIFLQPDNMNFDQMQESGNIVFNRMRLGIQVNDGEKHILYKEP